MKVTRRFTFSACHYLSNPLWSREENEKFYGKSANMHGHNFTVYVSVEGEVDRETGMVINLSNLKNAISPIIDELDHHCLNDLSYFKEKLPTLENIAVFIFKRAKPFLKDVILRSIKVEIGSEFSVEFYGKESLKRLSFKFSASHRLSSEKVGDKDVYGKCGEEKHGHDYSLEVWFQGDEKYAREKISQILNFLDHTDLDTVNELEFSTGEYIIKFLWGRIEKIEGISLRKLILRETENNFFEMP